MKMLILQRNREVVKRTNDRAICTGNMLNARYSCETKRTNNHTFLSLITAAREMHVLNFKQHPTRLNGALELSEAAKSPRNTLSGVPLLIKLHGNVPQTSLLNDCFTVVSERFRQSNFLPQRFQLYFQINLII